MIGKTLVRIDHPDEPCDVGLKLTFNDGTTLAFGYSGDEGTTWIDGVELDAVGFEELVAESLDKAGS